MSEKPLNISHAIILAAGLGKRMRPLTDKIPKPMLELCGQPLINHILDRLEDSEVSSVVVNTFYMAEVIANFLTSRPSPYTKVIRESILLDTGGGVKNALSLLGNSAFFAINSDSFWLNGPSDTLTRMKQIWNEDKMDGLLLLHSTVNAYGYSGRGDFKIRPTGQLIRRTEQEVCPFTFTGIQILHSRLFKIENDGAFSLNIVYDHAIKNGRLYGIVHDGEWFHIGTPKGLFDAEKYLTQRNAGVKHR